MTDLAERLAQAHAERERAAYAITESDILEAMDPNGATLKLGAIIAGLKDLTGFSEYALTANVQNKLRRMRKAGRVELAKGPGGGWRVLKAPR